MNKMREVGKGDIKEVKDAFKEFMGEASEIAKKIMRDRRNK